MIQIGEITKLDDLQAIVNVIKPFERCWCHSIQSEIVGFHTGFAVMPYDSETDRYLGGGYFVPYPNQVVHIVGGWNG